MKLTAENVNKIFVNCLFNEGEDTTNHVPAHGVMLKTGFHPQRLKDSEADIGAMLDCLSNDFKTGGGGGMSFLNMCVDKDGVHWGEHKNMDELLTLGLATKKIQYLMPREEWQNLPGNMPYLVIL